MCTGHTCTPAPLTYLAPRVDRVDTGAQGCIGSQRPHTKTGCQLVSPWPITSRAEAEVTAVEQHRLTANFVEHPSRRLFDRGPVRHERMNKILFSKRFCAEVHMRTTPVRRTTTHSTRS